MNSNYMTDARIVQLFETCNGDAVEFARLIAEMCAQSVGVQSPAACEKIQDTWQFDARQEFAVVRAAGRAVELAPLKQSPSDILAWAAGRTSGQDARVQSMIARLDALKSAK